MARQRVQHELVASPSLPPAGLLATVNAGGGAQIKEIGKFSRFFFLFFRLLNCSALKAERFTKVIESPVINLRAKFHLDKLNRTA